MRLVMRHMLFWLLLVLAGVVSACVATTADSSTTTSTTLPVPQPESTPTSSTSTTVLATTTTTAETPPRCRPNPFTEEFAADLAADYRSVTITAHVHDLRSNCGYSLNRDNRQITASVFKVMVMAGTLLEAQGEGRPVSEREMGFMFPMITESANGPVRSLWRSFGSSPWFREQGVIFGLRETRVAGDDGSAWGGTRTSALDQVNLLRQVLVGDWGPLEAEYRSVALDLMTSIVPEQAWGVAAGVPADWVVAQKNGFAGRTINSVGWVNEPGPSEGYVVAILTRGWSSHAKGIAAVERINESIAKTMTAPSG